jgi:hypothetical protein
MARGPALPAHDRVRLLGWRGGRGPTGWGRPRARRAYVRSLGPAGPRRRGRLRRGDERLERGPARACSPSPTPIRCARPARHRSAWLLAAGLSGARAPGGRSASAIPGSPGLYQPGRAHVPGQLLRRRPLVPARPESPRCSLGFELQRVLSRGTTRPRTPRTASTRPPSRGWGRRCAARWTRSRALRPARGGRGLVRGFRPRGAAVGAAARGPGRSSARSRARMGRGGRPLSARVPSSPPPSPCSCGKNPVPALWLLALPVLVTGLSPEPAVYGLRCSPPIASRFSVRRRGPAASPKAPGCRCGIARRSSPRWPSPRFPPRPPRAVP